jgi:ethanolamine utilization protein EutA (predicted chaperonin)
MQSHLLLWPFANFLRPLTSSPALDNGLKIRRSHFLYRIKYIKQTIQRLTEERSTIQAKQMKLSHTMKKVHDRMIELASESERVLAIDDNSSIISSPLLHGSRQAFTKSELERQLQNECV